MQFYAFLRTQKNKNFETYIIFLDYLSYNPKNKHNKKASILRVLDLKTTTPRPSTYVYINTFQNEFMSYLNEDIYWTIIFNYCNHQLHYNKSTLRNY